VTRRLSLVIHPICLIRPIRPTSDRQPATRHNLITMSTLFTKIINREIPGDIVYEDEHVVAFRDIEPQAPTHIVIATRHEITCLATLPDTGDHQHILNAAKTIAAQQGLVSYRVVINQGPDAGQSVEHLHAHLLGGRAFTWPPG
jgi:histidine triad (HIT) family protein